MNKSDFCICALPFEKWCCIPVVPELRGWAYEFLSLVIFFLAFFKVKWRDIWYMGFRQSNGSPQGFLLPCFQCKEWGSYSVLLSSDTALPSLSRLSYSSLQSHCYTSVTHLKLCRVGWESLTYSQCYRRMWLLMSSQTFHWPFHFLCLRKIYLLWLIHTTHKIPQALLMMTTLSFSPWRQEPNSVKLD